jgi:hypothetical protein
MLMPSLQVPLCWQGLVGAQSLIFSQLLAAMR